MDGDPALRQPNGLHHLLHHRVRGGLSHGLAGSFLPANNAAAQGLIDGAYAAHRQKVEELCDSARRNSSTDLSAPALSPD